MPSVGGLARRGAQVSAAALSAVLLLGIGYAWFNEKTLNDGVHSIRVDGLGAPAPTPSGAGSASPTSGTHVDGKAENILIVGDDSRAGLSQAQGRELTTGTSDETTSTDTLLIVHIPANGSRATLVSIPRDSYVDIPGGWMKNKINAAYADGYYHSGAKTAAAAQTAGADLLLATVKSLTGVTIDHYVQIGFAGFEKVVQAIGSITVNLCHAVDDTPAYNKAHGESGGSGFVSAAGIQHLNAVRALQFVRQRHNLPGIGDDLGREKRQQYFLSAAYDKILTAGVLLNPIKLNKVVRALADAVVKDPTFSIQALAEQLADLRANEIGGKTIPTTPGPLIPGVGSVLLVNPPAVRKFVRDAFYPVPAASTTTPGKAHASSAHATAPAKSACVD